MDDGTSCAVLHASSLIHTCHRRGATPWAAWRRRSRSRTTTAANETRWPRCAPTRSARRATATTAPGSRTRAWCRSRARSSTRRMPGAEPDRPAAASRRRDRRPRTCCACPQGAITEAGLRQNVNVGLRYLEAWLRGIGCVPLYNLMEDAATAEISRAQVWQWLRHGGALDDGRTVDARARTRRSCDEELAALRARRRRRGLARRVASSDAARPVHDLIDARVREFLTLRAYELLLTTMPAYDVTLTSHDPRHSAHAHHGLTTTTPRASAPPQLGTDARWAGIARDYSADGRRAPARDRVSIRHTLAELGRRAALGPAAHRGLRRTRSAR